jgi:hypothetical protein
MAWKYITAAFNARPFGIFVPPNWIAIGVIGLMGIFVDPGFWLVGAGAELGYLFLLSSSGRFRQSIDGSAMEALREANEERVSKIVSGLPGYSQTRYKTISVRCTEIIKNGGDSTSDLEQIAQGLDKLLWIYVKLLKTAQQLETVVNESTPGKRAEMDGRLHDLEQRLRSPSLSEDLRTSIEGTMSALKSRVTLQQEASDKLAYCNSELQRIEEEVERAREQSLVLTEPVAVSRQVNAITSGLGMTSQWIKEQQNIFGSTDELSDSGPIISLR